MPRKAVAKKEEEEEDYKLESEEEEEEDDDNELDLSEETESEEEEEEKDKYSELAEKIVNIVYKDLNKSIDYEKIIGKVEKLLRSLE